MIFLHTCDKVLNGLKTQTRRLDRPEQYAIVGAAASQPIERVLRANWRVVYEVGRTYAVQPGRGKPSVGRIRLVRIRYEDARQISEADAVAEGFADRYAFLGVWAEMHDPSWANQERMYAACPDDTEAIKELLWKESLTRPADRYMCWALDFELVTD